MADTETIRQIVKTGEAALPDRVQTLALAAIDELKRARCLIVKVTAIPFILAALVILFEIWHGG